jgi:hypothetical protein
VEKLRRWVESPGTGDLPTDAPRLSMDAHIKECVRCCLEAEEMRSFFAPAPGEESDRSRAETARIRDLLARTLASGPLKVPAPAAPQRVPRTAGTPPRPLWNRHPWVLALQMALVIGVGLVALVPFLRPDRAPSVPALDPGRGGLRGDLRPRLLEPRGEQISVPRHFAWEASETPAAGWVFRLERVDGSLIWSTATRTPSVELPAEAAGALRPGSRYVWRVQAASEPSTPVGASFEIAPGGTR